MLKKIVNEQKDGNGFTITKVEVSYEESNNYQVKQLLEFTYSMLINDNKNYILVPLNMLVDLAEAPAVKVRDE